MVRKLSFVKKTGEVIRGEAYIPDSIGTRYPTVIFSHGFGGCYKDINHYGQDFIERGIASVFFDFCGGGPYSKSDGTMAEMTVSSEIEDLICVIMEVQWLDFVDRKSLFLAGESMGGFVTAIAANLVSNMIRGIVLWYPAFVIPDGSRERLSKGIKECFGLPLSPYFDKQASKIDIYKEVSNYKGPVRIIHGDIDDIVPLDYSERAVSIYRDADLIVIPGAGHGYEGEACKIASNATIKFIKKNIETYSA
ncbi:MAG: alpha/beta hydrolase [Eubacterium sp.]|nr:alpha/beta hydrolase [Eubacterium sp.]